MKEIKKEGKNFKIFNKTESGASKFALFIMGIILGITSSALFGYMCGNYNATGNYKYYDWLLFVAIFLLIFTGELMGIYFGAYEEYVFHNKKEKIKVELEEKDISKKLIKDDKNKSPLVKKEVKVTRKENFKKTAKSKTDTKKVNYSKNNKTNNSKRKTSAK